ncbi:MAG: peroxide stress protein YaaA [Alphaproteobacteria bacterium]|nr:MAG: peroxide stress protein YaaA [Alphaproteobacteria bacterium]
MLVLISPAKKLDFDSAAPCKDFTEPRFQKQTGELVALAKKLSRADLKRLMNLSDKLAELNYVRYQNFQPRFTPDNAKQAAYAFRGDTYVGLDADTLSAGDLEYAQDHLRILSGLYGLLRPLDLMQPYRLEMGTKFANPKGEDLYDFWQDALTKAVNDDVSAQQGKAVINLASNEYIKAIKPAALGADFITPHFKEIKNGTPKVIGLFAKRARGAMARYIIQNRIETPEGLKDFSDGGYQYQPELSTEGDFVFTRPG